LGSRPDLALAALEDARGQALLQLQRQYLLRRSPPPLPEYTSSNYANALISMFMCTHIHLFSQIRRMCIIPLIEGIKYMVANLVKRKLEGAYEDAGEYREKGLLSPGYIGIML
jgi:hypothetical protein